MATTIIPGIQGVLRLAAASAGFMAIPGWPREQHGTIRMVSDLDSTMFERLTNGIGSRLDLAVRQHSGVEPKTSDEAAPLGCPAVRALVGSDAHFTHLQSSLLHLQGAPCSATCGEIPIWLGSRYGFSRCRSMIRDDQARPPPTTSSVCSYRSEGCSPAGTGRRFIRAVHPDHANHPQNVVEMWQSRYR